MRRARLTQEPAGHLAAAATSCTSAAAAASAAAATAEASDAVAASSRSACAAACTCGRGTEPQCQHLDELARLGSTCAANARSCSASAAARTLPPSAAASRCRACRSVTAATSISRTSSICRASARAASVLCSSSRHACLRAPLRPRGAVSFTRSYHSRLISRTA